MDKYCENQHCHNKAVIHVGMDKAKEALYSLCPCCFAAYNMGWKHRDSLYEPKQTETPNF